MPKVATKRLIRPTAPKRRSASAPSNPPAGGKSKALTMDELLAGSDIAQIKAGDVVEGLVSSVKKH